MRGKCRVANAPAGGCGVKNQVSCLCFPIECKGDEQKKYSYFMSKERAGRWELSVMSLRKCICELERGRNRILVSSSVNVR